MTALAHDISEKNDAGPRIRRIGQLFRRLWQVTGSNMFRSEGHRILATNGVADDAILQDFLQRVTAPKRAVPELRRDLKLKRNRFYSAVASQRAPTAEDVELLKEVVLSARVLWEQTEDDRAAKIAEESQTLLERYEKTGRFFSDDWNHG
jgi:hypothetical protein